MVKGTTAVRIRKEDLEKLKLKAQYIEKDINELTRRNIKVSMPMLFQAIANGAIEIDQYKTIQLFKIRRVRL